MSIQQKWCYPREDVLSTRLGDGIIRNHYYRYMAEDTDLYLFGCGLGDQAMMEQVGYSFLRYIDETGDPKLGRICISVGTGGTAFLPYRGDVNCAWVIAFSNREDWMTYFKSVVAVQPQLWLCPSKIIYDIVVDAGEEALYLPLACGEVFQPMNLPRKGFGYTGLDTKTQEQMDIVLGSVMNRDDFEWRGRTTEGPFFHLWELNEWYNSKLAVFGMFFPLSMQMGLVTGRVFETLGSGTPLICYENPAIDEILGDYRYQTKSVEETEVYIDEILENREFVETYLQEVSKTIHEHHSYLNRLKMLFKRLEEMR